MFCARRESAVLSIEIGPLSLSEVLISRNIPVSCQLEEVRPRSAGDGHAGAFFVGDRLAHSNKIPLILPIV